MSDIKAKALAILAQRKAEIAAKFGKPRHHAEIVVPDLTAIVLGRNEQGRPLVLPAKPRLEHSHIIGTTGGGKSNFLEHCIRQDIRNGFGVCVVDPHGNHPGSLYRSLLIWLEKNGYTKGGKNERTIHLIDPNAPTHAFCFNPLALPDETYDPAVIAAAAFEAIEQVWGGEDSNTKPTIQRVLFATFAALAALKLTLAEARLLYDPDDKSGLRALLIAKLKDEVTREEIEWLHHMADTALGMRDFRAEVTGPRNRINKILRALATRTIVGQTDGVIDLREAMDNRHIVLVNLSDGSRADKDATAMIGRLLTRFIFLNLPRRQNPQVPFFYYLDECQRYLSGDIADMLAEARKYGLGVVLSHQWQTQLSRHGEGSVGDPIVSALYGKVSDKEFGLMVTLGVYTSQAKNFARSKANLRLIDGSDLVDLILEHYETFDSRYKGLVPLKRIYVPESLEESDE